MILKCIHSIMYGWDEFEAVILARPRYDDIAPVWVLNVSKPGSLFSARTWYNHIFLLYCVTAECDHFQHKYNPNSTGTLPLYSTIPVTLNQTQSHSIRSRCDYIVTRLNQYNPIPPLNTDTISSAWTHSRVQSADDASIAEEEHVAGEVKN